MSYEYGYGAIEKFSFDTKHKNKYQKEKIIPAGVMPLRERNIILNNVRDHNGIVYGSTSSNLQAPTYMRKLHTDVDALVKRSKPFALEVEMELDQWANHNNYYVTELHIPGKATVYRIRNRLRNKEAVADISPLENHPSVVYVNGLQVIPLAIRERKLRRLLKDPSAVYRHKKDIINLLYVVRFRKYKSKKRR